jgi:hypothetical protein
MPDTCPVCKSERIRQYGMGTERVEAEVQALFPRARTLRWDYETTRKKGAHDVILGHFVAGRADILIGTQMLAKGLDLPLVTLVGAVLADVGLNLPDYRAPERSFQVLTQVAGRAGRSPLGGEVILQAFQPEHYVIQAAAGHNYPSPALSAWNTVTIISRAPKRRLKPWRNSCGCGSGAGVVAKPILSVRRRVSFLAWRVCTAGRLYCAAPTRLPYCATVIWVNGG